MILFTLFGNEWQSIHGPNQSCQRRNMCAVWWLYHVHVLVLKGILSLSNQASSASFITLNPACARDCRLIQMMESFSLEEPSNDSLWEARFIISGLFQAHVCWDLQSIIPAIPYTVERRYAAGPLVTPSSAISSCVLDDVSVAALEIRMFDKNENKSEYEVKEGPGGPLSCVQL